MTRGARAWLQGLPWTGILLVCATLGLAPFHPPHVLEKIGMLVRGELVRPIDWFDLVLHAAPWLVLAGKAGAGARRLP